MHTDIYQLFVLLQILPTVDKYFDNHKYASNFQQYLLFYFKIPTVLFSQSGWADPTVLVASNAASYYVHVGLSTGVSNTMKTS